tara:strand:- start:245 stop:571 length:327 start_codon:yes stop_codon:yes gene_type:complete
MIDFFMDPLTINHYLIFSSMIFVLGLIGIVLNGDDFIKVLMSIEIALLGINLNFISFSYYSNDVVGHIFSLFIIIVSSCNLIIGLAIVFFFIKQDQIQNSRETETLEN